MLKRNSVFSQKERQSVVVWLSLPPTLCDQQKQLASVSLYDAAVVISISALSRRRVIIIGLSEIRVPSKGRLDISQLIFIKEN